MPKIERRAKSLPLDARGELTETSIQFQIREALGMIPGVLLHRNALVHGEEWNPTTGAVRHIQGGLGPGTADLIGLVRCDACFGVGVFFALEVKKPKQKAKPHQAEWLALVRKLGGFACVVASVQEAIDAVARCKRGETE